MPPAEMVGTTLLPTMGLAKFRDPSKASKASKVRDSSKASKIRDSSKANKTSKIRKDKINNSVAAVHGGSVIGSKAVHMCYDTVGDRLSGMV